MQTQVVNCYLRPYIIDKYAAISQSAPVDLEALGLRKNSARPIVKAVFEDGHSIILYLYGWDDSFTCYASFFNNGETSGRLVTGSEHRKSILGSYEFEHDGNKYILRVHEEKRITMIPRTRKAVVSRKLNRIINEQKKNEESCENLEKSIEGLNGKIRDLMQIRDGYKRTLFLYQQDAESLALQGIRLQEERESISTN